MAVASEFTAALEDIIGNLPAWWATEEGTKLRALLKGASESIDALSFDWQGFYEDQSLKNASEYGLLNNFAFAWGVQNERLPPTVEQLRAYIEARTQENGSVSSLLHTLTTLLETPQNTTGGTVLKFPTPTVKNLIPNPVFGAVPATATVEGGTGAQSEVWSKFGTHSFAVEKTVSAGSIEAYFATGSPGTSWQSVTGSQPVTFSFYAHAPVIARLCHARIVFANVTNEVVGELVGTAVEDTTALEGTRISVTGTVPVAATKCRPDVVIAGMEVAEKHYFTALQLTETNAAIPFAAGSLEDYRWSGEANNSMTEGPTGLQFPANGEGLRLYQFAPGEGPKGALRFPPNGEGLKFPSLPESVLSEETLTGATGATPPGAGYGIQFALNGYVEILQNTPGPYETEVVTLNWLDFDRNAFRRAVERFRQAHCYATTIRELAQTEV